MPSTTLIRSIAYCGCFGCIVAIALIAWGDPRYVQASLASVAIGIVGGWLTGQLLYRAASIVIRWAYGG